MSHSDISYLLHSSSLTIYFLTGSFSLSLSLSLSPRFSLSSPPFVFPHNFLFFSCWFVNRLVAVHIQHCLCSISVISNYRRGDVKSKSSCANLWNVVMKRQAGFAFFGFCIFSFFLGGGGFSACVYTLLHCFEEEFEFMNASMYTRH